MIPTINNKPMIFIDRDSNGELYRFGVEELLIEIRNEGDDWCFSIMLNNEKLHQSSVCYHQAQGSANSAIEYLEKHYPQLHALIK